MAAALILAAMTGCFFQGEEEPEPTEAPDLAATIAAAVSAAVPTATPVPTNTPTPEPDLAATLQAMMAATLAAIPPTPTAVPPTAVPVQPTATPVPDPVQPTATPVPTNTPVPPQAPARQEFEIPCIVAGKVTIGGSSPPAGTPVYAVSQGADGTVVAEAKTDREGSYQLAIKYSGEPFDIYVRTSDSGVDTSACTRSGSRDIINLTVQ